MEGNLFEALGPKLTPILKERAGDLGVTPEQATGLGKGALPAVLGGLGHLGSTQEGSQKILDLMKQQGAGGTSADVSDPNLDVRGLAQKGQGLLGPLFGDKLDGVVGHLTRSSGVGSGAAKGVLGLVSSLSLGHLARDSVGLDANGLKDKLASSLPASAGGFGRVTGRLEEAEEALKEKFSRGTEHIHPPETGYRRPMPPRRFPVVPVVLGIFLLAILWSLFRSHPPERMARTEPTTGRVLQGRAGTPEARSTLIHLPSGQTLSAASGSAPFVLANSLAGRTGEPTQPIPLEGVRFDSGSSSLPTDARGSVAKVAAVLKAYPNAQVRVEATADSQAVNFENHQLAVSRADTIRGALVAQGVSPNQVQARGGDVHGEPGASLTVLSR
jgi:outer membrane protein OmpA-like peptidoglycan-associated protein